MDLQTPADANFTDNFPQIDELVSRIQLVVEEALESGSPLEVEPARTKLFDVFATAFAAGQTKDDGGLGADDLTRLLGQRWGLDQSAQKSMAEQQKLGEADLAKMRLLWSTLRLWMEWDYAWNRWTDFHKAANSPNRPR